MNKNIEFDKKRIGRRIRLKRLLWGMSREDVCKDIHTSRNNLKEIELGKRMLPLHIAHRLTVRFGLSLDYLYYGIETNHILPEPKRLSGLNIEYIDLFWLFITSDETGGITVLSLMKEFTGTLQ